MLNRFLIASRPGMLCARLSLRLPERLFRMAPPERGQPLVYAASLAAARDIRKSVARCASAAARKITRLSARIASIQPST